MSFGDQAQARKAAAKFIETNAGPNRLMAIVNFGGSLVITQNFTNDVDRLKAVVTGIKGPWTSTAADNSGPMANLNRAAAEFGTRDMILGLRSLAKNLSDVPGRKTLILLTAGFPINDEQRFEVTAAIDACNKANVAIYPIDVRGLVAGGPTGKFDDARIKGGLSLELAASGVFASVLVGSAFLEPVAYDPVAMGFFGPSPARRRWWRPCAGWRRGRRTAQAVDGPEAVVEQAAEVRWPAAEAVAAVAVLAAGRRRQRRRHACGCAGGRGGGGGARART